MNDKKWKAIIGVLVLVFVFIFANTFTFAADPASVVMTWTAPGDDGNIGTASQYDIRYSTSPINIDNWDDAIQVQDEPTPQVSGSPEILTITDLEPNTTYYFAIKTADEVLNWSEISNIASITTDDTVPPSTIMDLLLSLSE